MPACMYKNIQKILYTIFAIVENIMFFLYESYLKLLTLESPLWHHDPILHTHNTDLCDSMSDTEQLFFSKMPTRVSRTSINIVLVCF